MVIWHVDIKYMVDVGIFDVAYIYIYTHHIWMNLYILCMYLLL